MPNGEIGMRGMVRGCRWCAFMPITFGAVLFVLGYYLDAEVVRILWLIFTGFMVIMGIFMFVMASVFFR